MTYNYPILSNFPSRYVNSDVLTITSGAKSSVLLNNMLDTIPIVPGLLILVLS